MFSKCPKRLEQNLVDLYEVPYSVLGDQKKHTVCDVVVPLWMNTDHLVNMPKMTDEVCEQIGALQARSYCIAEEVDCTYDEGSDLWTLNKKNAEHVKIWDEKFKAVVDQCLTKCQKKNGGYWSTCRRMLVRETRTSNKKWPRCKNPENSLRGKLLEALNLLYDN